MVSRRIEYRAGRKLIVLATRYDRDGSLGRFGSPNVAGLCCCISPQLVSCEFVWRAALRCHFHVFDIEVSISLVYVWWLRW